VAAADEDPDADEATGRGGDPPALVSIGIGTTVYGHDWNLSIAPMISVCLCRFVKLMSFCVGRVDVVGDEGGSVGVRGSKVSERTIRGESCKVGGVVRGMVGDALPTKGGEDPRLDLVEGVEMNVERVCMGVTGSLSASSSPSSFLCSLSIPVSCVLGAGM
jgi:hypothetical protein